MELRKSLLCHVLSIINQILEISISVAIANYTIYDNKNIGYLISVYVLQICET